VERLVFEDDAQLVTSLYGPISYVRIGGLPLADWLRAKVEPKFGFEVNLGCVRITIERVEEAQHVGDD